MKDFVSQKKFYNIWLISKADPVIVPSSNKGLSLPVFDAFSLGTRVILL
jgi:hypothetical protein